MLNYAYGILETQVRIAGGTGPTADAPPRTDFRISRSEAARRLDCGYATLLRLLDGYAIGGPGA